MNLANRCTDVGRFDGEADFDGEARGEGYVLHEIRADGSLAGHGGRNLEAGEEPDGGACEPPRETQPGPPRPAWQDGDGHVLAGRDGVEERPRSGRGGAEVRVEEEEVLVSRGLDSCLEGGSLSPVRWQYDHRVGAGRSGGFGGFVVRSVVHDDDLGEAGDGRDPPDGGGDGSCRAIGGDDGGGGHWFSRLPHPGWAGGKSRPSP